jgi:hypothetical protein
MKKDDVRLVLSKCLRKYDVEYDTPTNDDWMKFEAFFGTKFPQSFRSFIDLMAEFSFPGDIYNVKNDGYTNGNDDIISVYTSESSFSDWSRNLIPFYGIGNGDYFVIDAGEGEKSAVYYRYHETGEVEKYSSSFDEWIEKIPEFLNGE